MAIYEDEKLTREDLFELRKKNICSVCRGALDVFLDVDKGKAFLACSDWRRTQHQGIERVAQPPFEPNILTRREEMVEQLGKDKATQLERYGGVVSLTKAEAIEILKTIWPNAPEIEVLKAGIICHQYGLNPLMRHIFLIPFKKRKEGKVIGEDWAVVQGIGSNRLIARRRHNYSYLDMTPRRMTEEEQQRVNGEVDDTKIWALTHLKDMDTGAEAIGVGSWPVDETPYGTEKGNTKLNMACIRSEREALDRLYPAEMPQGVEVMEEKYIDAKFTLLDGGERAALAAEESKDKAQAAVAPPSEVKSQKIAGAPPTAEGASQRDYDKKMIYSSAGKLGWNEKRLLKELKERTGIQSITSTMEQIPDDKFHEIASKLTDLAECA
jgi:hypothetical protein